MAPFSWNFFKSYRESIFPSGRSDIFNPACWKCRPEVKTLVTGEHRRFPPVHGELIVSLDSVEQSMTSLNAGNLKISDLSSQSGFKEWFTTKNL